MSEVEVLPFSKKVQAKRTRISKTDYARSKQGVQKLISEKTWMLVKAKKDYEIYILNRALKRLKQIEKDLDKALKK